MHLRVKPVPIIIFIVAHAYRNTRDVADMAISDTIVVAFFFLLRPGEYIGTLSDDAAFKIEGVSLHVQGRTLDFSMASDAEIKASTSAYYTFTTQNNNNRNEKVVQGLSGDPWCCPVKANIRRMLHHRGNKSRCTVPFASYYRGNRKTLVNANDVTEVLRNAMRINGHRTGIEALEVSARSLRAGGAMALLHPCVSLSNIQMMGRWHSHAVM
jgi:hypothetical protein